MKPTTHLLMPIILGLLFSSPIHAQQAAGWIEPVKIMPGGHNLMAKLDTGAENSSLNTSQIEIIEKDDATWVRFLLRTREGDLHTMESRLVKTVRIKRHFGNSQQRPLIHLDICLGKVKKNVPVNLVDRSGFKYQLLIGRSFLSGSYLVDSNQTETLQPTCDQ